MTDTTTFFNTIVTVVRNFDSALQQLKDISDRISADTALSTALYNYAQTTSNRKELAIADFDNLNLAVQALTNHLNTAGLSVTPPVNTGGTVKLAYYKIM